jgi:type VI protein secretion system component VasF
MGEPARIPPPLETPPLHDPKAIARSYRYHRARRAARIERRREQRWARLRFWVVLLCLLLAVAVIGVLILQQVQNVFGI